jgi:hypothetical protein
MGIDFAILWLCARGRTVKPTGEIMMLRKTVTAILGGVFVMAWGVVAAQQAEVVTVTQTEVKRIAGEVVEVRSNLLTLRADDGSGRAAYRIPRGASISVAGVQTRLQDLQPGQKIRIYYRETETGRVIVLSPPEETEVVTIVEEVEMEPAPPPAPEPPPAMLPSTASIMPLLGLLGVGFMALGGGVAVWRRRG